ncbi:peptide-methionine (S)-S-oxide reductase MsrA [Mobiluncus curtisii]|uniref:Peptide methionine sulfoxide reductase MsrA n=2 Tax=Mobiluncus curtisii TaxID=2051 RepID=D6ZJU0_MOBCV|nr:peptide-methionine (S)-S-oxide reductase MsrA [Mobiluncus curtisii]ADI66989.1 peptide-methionine (S)-S-oxide reductase [Mobiluncus curtisii ATCC 43063]QQU09216.1 peptide-methionine (S)-S-oxide reductase MsrA [Mobiluncus curtisii]
MMVPHETKQETTHPVLHTSITGPWPEPHEVIYFAMGCFWGVERIFWSQPGVINTAVGYMAGQQPTPSYEEVCTGITGHAETVRVVFDPTATTAGELLKVFWENHDPTQGDRQGNDRGSQYRSLVICTTPEQRELAEVSRRNFGATLAGAGRGAITTEILDADAVGQFWLTEDYHQAYLFHHPHGYCNHGFKGFVCEVPVRL